MTTEAEVEALRARIVELEGLVYVPGAWRCQKCGFSLMQANLNAHTGAVSARDKPGEKCPNDGAPLWRVTERDAANEQAEIYREMLSRRAEAIPA